MATNASPDTSANPSKDRPACRGRDGPKATQDDATEETDNNPPNHGIPTNGVAWVLWNVDLEQIELKNGRTDWERIARWITRLRREEVI